MGDPKKKKETSPPAEFPKVEPPSEIPDSFPDEYPNATPNEVPGAPIEIYPTPPDEFPTDS